jgi:hypothetical protein
VAAIASGVGAGVSDAAGEGFGGVVTVVVPPHDTANNARVPTTTRLFNLMSFSKQIDLINPNC